MSIATEIQRLQQAKADIKTAIENKGVTVGDGTIDTFASKISEITGGGGSGIPTGYKTVTFKNGDNVIFERLVLSGDDCPDPVTQGRIETPTKESTVQYNYTYKGWSEALTNITEDKVIYATFTETVRKYTVTFYDEDGTTVLNTEQVAYGGSSTYTYKKEGYMFVGWTPEPTNITSDLSCIGAWQESYSFADASWEYIAQMSESGQASQAFSIGDTKKEVIGEKEYTLEIIGFDKDTIYGTDTKAGITIWIKNYDTAVNKNMISLSPNTRPWNTGNLHTKYEEPIFDLMDTSLQSFVKSVIKEYQTDSYSKSSCSAKIWSLSVKEIGGESRSWLGVEENETYQKFAEYPDKASGTVYPDINLSSAYWLRSTQTKTTPVYVSSNGVFTSVNTGTRSAYVRPCFCI